MEYYSAIKKNTFESVLMRWMKLEPIIQSEVKILLMKVKVESEKVVWKLSIQKTKIMTSGPITSWQIDGERVETVADFIFLNSKITADGDCTHEIKRRLLLGRKVMTNLDSIFKSRDTTLPTKVRLVKAVVSSACHFFFLIKNQDFNIIRLIFLVVL